MRQNGGFLSSRGAKLLIGLPLLLAAFALSLQVRPLTPQHPLKTNEELSVTVPGQVVRRWLILSHIGAVVNTLCH